VSTLLKLAEAKAAENSGSNYANPWYDPNKGHGGRKGDYMGYDEDVYNKFVAADVDGDGIISKNEYKSWDNQEYDIIGDNHAPFYKGKWDRGAARQRALLRGLTRNNLSLEDTSVLAHHGIWQDNQTGDLYGATGYKSDLWGRKGDDTLSSYAGHFKKDDANMAGTYFDFADWDDDGAPVYKYAYQGDWTPAEEEVTACPAGQIRGTSGACIDDKTYAENPWEEPKKTPQALVDKRTDWDANWDPNRSGITSEQQGSIPFYTAGMLNEKRKNKTDSVTSGKFSSFLDGFDDDSDDEQKKLESYLRATEYQTL
jgi:hypothetical protein